MKTKARKWLLAIVLLVVTILSAVIVCVGTYLFKSDPIPEHCNYIDLRNGCARINSDGAIVWSDGSQHTPISCDDYSQMYELSDVLENLKLTKADILPTDVQLLEIRFEHRTWVEPQIMLDNIYLAFDFYTKKLYALKNDVWYYMENSPKLDELISESLDGQFAVSLRGESTFSSEEFVDSDFDNATFRYNVYWTAFSYKDAIGSIQLSGFKNTDEVIISTRAEAIVRAAEELGYDNPVAVTFFDETCNYYKVEIANDNGSGIMKDDDGVMTFIEPIYTVIIDDMGRTVELYPGYTRSRPFWPKNEGD